MAGSGITNSKCVCVSVCACACVCARVFNILTDNAKWLIEKAVPIYISTNSM